MSCWMLPPELMPCKKRNWALSKGHRPLPDEDVVQGVDHVCLHGHESVIPVGY